MLYKYKNKLVWFDRLNEFKIIIHNDIDAILTGGFLLQRGAEIVGMYDLRNIFYTKWEYKNMMNKNPENILAMDLDINLKNIKCFGHHIVPPFNPNAFNANDLLGITGDNFTSKCPLNSILLLYSLYEIKPKNDYEIALILYADSVIDNYVKYKDNVVFWLTKLELLDFLDALENRFDKLIEIINEKIKPITIKFEVNEDKEGKIKLQNSQNLNDSERKYPQCTQYIDFRTYTYQTTRYCTGEDGKPSIKNIEGRIEDLLKLVEDIMGWDMSKFPLQYCKYIDNFYKPSDYKIKFENKDYFNIVKILEESKEDIVSMAFSYSNYLQITTYRYDYNHKKENEFLPKKSGYCDAICDKLESLGLIKIEKDQRNDTPIYVKSTETGKIATYQLKGNSAKI